MASMHVMMGPPGTLGSANVGIGGATAGDGFEGSSAPREGAVLGASSPPPASAPLAAADDDDEVITMEVDKTAMKRYKSMQDLAPDSPAVALIRDSVVLAIDMFKLCMASMLVVFVPQKCPASTRMFVLQDAPQPSGIVGKVSAAVAHFEVRWDGCNRQPVDHDCPFQENFVCLSPFNTFVLVWNFMCLTLLVGHYFLVWRREHFLISHFKETLTLGRLHVKDVIGDYPTVEIKLRKFNRWVFNTSVVAIVFQLINIITSAIVLFVYFNTGYKTFTTFFTNLLLISLVLYNCISAAYVGLKHQLAYSCVAFEPVSYNSLSSNCIKGQ